MPRKSVYRRNHQKVFFIFGFELTREEKYYYLTKYYCPKKQNSLFKKHCIKGEAENLRHQL